MKHLGLVLMVSLMAFAACNDDSVPTPTDNTKNDDDQKEEPAPTKQDLLEGKWVIEVATFNGSPDGSNRNDRVEFMPGGFYTKESLSGDYMWSNADSTELICDYEKSYQSTWEVLELTETSFKVDLYFKGNPNKFHWEMKKQ